MRIAVLSDIHGNLAAFEAALAHARAQSPDQIVLAGDYVNGGPDSLACWQMARDCGLPIVRGNHERYLFDAGTERQHPRWATPWFNAVRFAYRDFSESDFEDMRQLPYDWHGDDVYVVHSTKNHDHDLLPEEASIEALSHLFPGITESLIIRGHNHHHRIDQWQEKTIMTSGSVGIGLAGAPLAVYSLATRNAQGWQTEHQFVAYNLNRTLQRFDETGYIQSCGIIGELYRQELMTGKNTIVAFIERYRDNLDSGKTTWNWAWEDFQKHHPLIKY